MNDLLKDFPIQVEQELVWGDMDAFQHINNAVFFRYFEDVRMLCFEEIGVNEHMTEHNVGPILANTQADFKAPLIYPDKITVGIKVDDIQTKRFLTHYSIYSHKLNRIAGTGTGLIVYYDYSQGKSCTIPDSIRQNLLSLL